MGPAASGDAGRERRADALIARMKEARGYIYELDVSKLEALAPL